MQLPFLDLVCFNVYLENQDRFRAYLARLQNIAGDRPLIMSEVGLDAMRNGESKQAEVLDWQVRTSFASGCAGVVLFSWTDEWYRAGAEVEDWAFGITDRQRRPKPALRAVREAFANVPFRSDAEWPRISVAVCSYNGSRTIRECLEGLKRVEYPNFEVIVVNDGSTDATAAIAGEYNCRIITTENAGLSSARNTALRAANGEIIAYLDDDAIPDRHWLHYLAATFRETDYAAVGGPNIAPPHSNTIADCVDNAPGGPVHVLITDEIAEHLPGCNMAIRKSCLEAVGGFDPTFRVAGDDVDLCWRLQERGWTLGFSPGAMVLHHRRNTIRGYWKQQQGYGKAEALLENKWPDKYNSAGHHTFSGRMYGRGMIHVLFRRTWIYHGVGGFAPFQSLYERAARYFWRVTANARVVFANCDFHGIFRFWLSLETAVSGGARCSGGARFIFDASDNRGSGSVVLHRSSSWNRESSATMSHRVSSPAPAARATERSTQFRSNHVATARHAGFRHAAATLLCDLDRKLAGSGGKARTNPALLTR